jgi:hypothetical protein
MTTTKRKVMRDARGFISSIVDEDGSRLVAVRRDEQGRLLGVKEYRDAASPSAPEVLERVDRVEQGLATTRRTTGELAQLLDFRSEKLRRRLDVATTPPPTPTLEEYETRYRVLSARLGSRRDASALHLGLLAGVTAAAAGDLPGAVRALRDVEDQP